MTIIKTWLKVFHKHKSYTAINIFGLSVGFALLMVIVLLLRFDLSYDKHWSDSEHIYRIDSKFFQENTSDQMALSSKLLPERLKKNIPEIEAIARFSRPRKLAVQRGEKMFTEEKIIFSDNESIDLFELDFIEGNPKELLKSPLEIIISDELRSKWFSEGETALNQIVRIRNRYYTIKGIFKSLPKNTHLQFDGLMSYSTILKRYESMVQYELDESIWSPDAYCFIKLTESADLGSVEQKIQKFIDENIRPVIVASGSVEELKPILVNLEQTHFSKGSEFDLPKGNRAFIRSTAIIGFVILLIISINYSNLSMAILVQRHKELGMRRLLGAHRAQIMAQIVGESLICVLLSFALGLIWLFIFDSIFPLEGITMRNIEINTLFSVKLMALSFGGIIILAILSSFYPAIIFSKTSIIDINQRKSGSNAFKNIMITVQFVASFMVISSMLLMKSQVDLLMAFDIGITRSPVVSVELGQNSTPNQVKLVKEMLKNGPGIKNVTDAILQQNSLLGTYNINTELNTAGKRTETVISAGFIGLDYCDVFEIDLKNGRSFRKDIFESNSVLVNQRLADQLYQGDAIDKPIHFRNKTYNIIGIVENFYYRSLREDLEPMALFPTKEYNQDEEAVQTSFQIKIDKENQESSLQHIRKVFAQTHPDFPFSFKFISEKISSFYQEDKNETAITAILGFSAIIIAVFGLVGLISFELNQRMKELCIRKILGANHKSLFFSVSRKQFFLLLIACSISIPSTFLFISDWLNDFSFTINLNTYLLISTLISLSLVFALVLMAMSLKFLEIIKINPAQILRHE